MVGTYTGVPSTTAGHRILLQVTICNCFAHRYIERGEGRPLRGHVGIPSVTSHQLGDIGYHTWIRTLDPSCALACTWMCPSLYLDVP
jgi:hypothetical protein